MPKESTLPRFLYVADSPQHETIFILHNRHPHCILRSTIEDNATIRIALEKKLDPFTHEELADIGEKAENWLRKWLSASLNIEDEYTPDLSKINIDLTLEEALAKLEAAMLNRSVPTLVNIATEFFRQLNWAEADRMAQRIILSNRASSTSPGQACLSAATTKETKTTDKLIEACFVASKLYRR